MKVLFSLLSILTVSIALSQNSENKLINLSNIKFCDLKVSDLKKQDPNLQEIAILEMSLCPDGFVTDSRFENRKGYVSKLYPGVIFQKYNNRDLISKVRLTKEFKGNLPDGTYINMAKLSAKNVLDKYPTFNSWTSRDCSDFLALTNNETYFYVKLDKAKKPRYPINEKYYLTKPIEGIDIIIDCYKTP
ncbi:MULTISPECIES: hypothetical protein [Flavobacterium]|uniref:hypothetical protein n=1 Tax=Flavobacterium TaxID=237 RepID=UPI002808E973|nr:hypothetical protein [Flavobacterium lindanitolerans]MDQ7961052.1 hypothetical protein [Flavobacterium lindanitolerans]